MSIKETKLFKGSVETPILKTNEIEYMGHELPLYDVVNEEYITTPKVEEIEIGKAESYQTAQTSYIRLLPHSPVFINGTALSLKKLQLDFASRSSTVNQFIILCVYGHKNGQYIYLGSSSNSFYNPKINVSLTFNFDNVNLFQVDQNNEIKLFTEVFIKPYVVTVDGNGVITDALDDVSWDSERNTIIKLSGCSKLNSSFNYTPHVVTSGDQNMTPHCVISYSKSVSASSLKIPHNLNSSIHISLSDKEKIDRLSNLGDIILAQKADFTPVCDTRKAEFYVRTGTDVVCSYVIKPESFIGNKLKTFILRGISGGNSDYIITDKWLQADCKNESGDVIATFLSIHRSSQSTDFTTTWQFQNFVIDESYKTIEFRLSQSGTTRQETYINMTGSSLRNSSGARLLYKEGWITKWAQGQNVNDIRDNQFTGDFCMIFEQTAIRGVEFIQHISDKNLHITEEERSKIDGWIEVADNDTIQNNIDVRHFNPNFTGFGSQSIVGFIMAVEQSYKNLVITGLDLRRYDNSSLNTNQLYLYAQCLDVDDEQIEVFYSTGTATQSSDDNKVMSWEFEDFVIPKNCSKIKFYCTTIVGQKQTNNRIRTCVLTVNGANLYKDGWKTIWPGGSVQNFTTDFAVYAHRKTSTIIEHPKDAFVHLNQNDRDKINSIDDVKTSVDELNTSINNVNTSLENHAQSTTLHWQESDRTDITSLKSHVNDNARHVSATQTEKWDSAVTEVKTVKTDVERLLQSRDENFTTQFDGTEAPNNGKSSARCIQLSSAHFTSGVIKEIEIPYYGGESVTGYLCVQIFSENETNDTIKELDECYFSINPQTQLGNGSCVYQFDNLVIPKEYKFIRLMIVPNKETAPNIKVDVDSCPQFRMRCLSKDSSFTFDDDDCLIWTGSQDQTNYLSLVNCVKVISPLNELNNIISIINELQSEIATLRSELDELKNNSTI